MLNKKFIILQIGDIGSLPLYYRPYFVSSESKKEAQVARIVEILQLIKRKYSEIDMSRTAVGGVTFGVIGAVIGATIAKKTNGKYVDRILLKIITSDIDNPIFI